MRNLIHSVYVTDNWSVSSAATATTVVPLHLALVAPGTVVPVPSLGSTFSAKCEAWTDCR